MSGHSKWATIKRQKGAADIKRGATFTKLSNAITLAIKQGGGISDTASNFKLRLAIDAAKASNMPKDTIERAIIRASGKDASNFEELIYEGFAPGGVAVIVETATDNTNRTSNEIKGIFNKSGASFGQPGSVSYLFETKGAITLAKNGKTFDEIFEDSVEMGAEDIEEVGEDALVYTASSDLARIKETLLTKGYEIVSADIERKPMAKIQVDGETRDKVITFLATLEELDDVQKVYSNIST